ncbi:dTDP-4-amino-4,6-dideoxy-D-galactose acyltransferase [Fundidesulfovibrio butyratiphilus]
MSVTNRLIPLAWDSDHFGLPMGRIEASGLEDAAALRLAEEARARGLALVEAFCEVGDPASVAALEGAGFRHLEVKVHLDMALDAPSETSPPRSETALSPATPEQAPGLAQAFCRSFADSRYLRTPGVSVERVHALYATWIDKSVRGTFDHLCLTLTRDGRAAGICTLRFDAALARIGLFAMHRDFRGQGLGLALLQGVADHARQRGLSALAVTTQGGNIPALRLYGRAGFLVRRIQLCMYRRLP